MSDTPTTAIARARQALENWFGESPARSLDIVLPGTSEPTIGIQIFVDIDEEDPEENMTYLATAGLSAAPLAWNPGGAELLLCVKGDWEIEELLPLVNMLGTISLQLREQPAALNPGTIFELSELPVFEGMKHLLVTRWSEDGGQLESEPAIQLLSLNPLYDDEAMALDGMDEAEALAWLDEQGVDVDDPLRDSAVAPEMSDAMGTGGMASLFGGMSPEQAMAALTGEGKGQFELTQAMQRMAGDMQSMLEDSLPGFVEQMQAQLAAGQAHSRGLNPESFNDMLSQLQKIIDQGESALSGDGPVETQGEELPEDPSSSRRNKH